MWRKIFKLRFRRPAAPADGGYGKRFTFRTDGETSFTNFTASEIISILVSMRGEDAMSARFGDGK